MKYFVLCLLSLIFQVKSSEDREKRSMDDSSAAVSSSDSSARSRRSVFLVGGQCPGGEPLGIPCDAKRPWPQCPPQSFCYATNSVDVGPYCCCPVWSTLGAAWRPAAPYYPYYPPMPSNWPSIIQATSSWGAPISQYAGTISQFGPLLELLQHRAMLRKQPADEEQQS